MVDVERNPNFDCDSLTNYDKVKIISDCFKNVTEVDQVPKILRPTRVRFAMMCQFLEELSELRLGLPSQQTLREIARIRSASVGNHQAEVQRSWLWCKSFKFSTAAHCFEEMLHIILRMTITSSFKIPIFHPISNSWINIFEKKHNLPCILRIRCDRSSSSSQWPSRKSRGWALISRTSIIRQWTSGRNQLMAALLPLPLLLLTANMSISIDHHHNNNSAKTYKIPHTSSINCTEYSRTFEIYFLFKFRI